ncbi:MAG: tRNA (adenosine(37)-N6)-dimethylallyltransferase MiaA, partial [Candidatus Pacebacteria bacterium]|nr:tRNA (adenosine(37)-N6)-dimethylallyltransferase MiaA [Candidatus Paceibacterota bacterium]
MEKLIIVAGPTSSGKTSYAIKLAKKIGGEVISADSRQVYKGLNLLSGKVTKKEMAGIPHHLLDITNPKKIFSVSDYQKLANKAIADILSRNKVPIICGGTGFYIDAIVYDRILPEVPPNKKLRAILEKKTIVELFKMLVKLDPARANTIDKDNPVRLIRAIEIAKALGSVPKLSKPISKYEVEWIM